MSEAESREAPRAHPWLDPVSGLFAATALFVSLVALAYHPLPVSVAAFLLALIAALMSPRHERLAGLALAVAGVCFVAGMTIAIVTDKPLW